MKSPNIEARLEPNPILAGRKKGERLPVLQIEEFADFSPAPSPKERAWREAPGMPYDDGLANARAGALIEWTPERKAIMAEVQSRGDKVAMVRLMKEWSETCP